MEQWRDVPGFDGYQVSDMGRVRSYRSKSGTMKEPRYISTKSAWYVGVNLRRYGKNYMTRISNIVMLAFIGPRPAGSVVRHLNDIKTDNRLCNLAYGTEIENKQDAVRNGRRGLSCDSANKLRSEYFLGGVLMSDLAIKYGISLSAVSLIINVKRHVDCIRLTT